MTYHSQTLNIQSDPEMIDAIGPNRAPDYRLGHRDARHAAAEISARAESEIARLRKCLADTRHEICLGPVDDTLWHHESPACTSVDNITLTLGDDWSYDDWLSGQSTHDTKEQSDD